MANSFFVMTLLRLEIDRLEKLGRLETRLHSVAPTDRAAVQGKIDSTMDEIAKLNRNIEEYRANHLSQ
jgi:hypothetical protein